MTMITERLQDDTFSRPAQLRPPLLAAFRSAACTLATSMLDWIERARQRRELLGLSDRDLHAFGVSRCDAVGEGSKPFWRP